MKITREALSEMIAVEVRRRLRELVEKDDEKKDKKKSPHKLSTADASDSPSPQGDVPVGPRATTGSPSVSTPETDQDSEASGPSVDGSQPDPTASATELDPEDEKDAIDPEGDGGEGGSGAVNDEMSGKTIQAITIEPRSKIMPGFKEIVIATNESTDVLRILVANGEGHTADDMPIVKFYWRNQTHDLP